MHPDISKFPSAHFYHGELKDGPSMANKSKKAWHESPLFPPYAFMHVAGTESRKGFSWVNATEVSTALALYTRLLEDFPTTEEFSYTVGVVTPYKSQNEELERVFMNKFGTDILKRVAFNTVDVRILCSNKV